MNIIIIGFFVLSLAACAQMEPMDPETRAALLGYYGNKAAINQYQRQPIYRPELYRFQPIGPKLRCTSYGAETTCY